MQEKHQSSDILEQALVSNDSREVYEKLANMVTLLDVQPIITEGCDQIELLLAQSTYVKLNVPFSSAPSSTKTKVFAQTFGIYIS